MSELINPGFSNLVLAAVKAARAFFVEQEPSLAFIPRRDVPRFKENEHGFPAVIEGSRVSASGVDPIDWDWIFGAKKGKFAKFDPEDVPEFQTLIEFAVSDPELIRRISFFGVREEDSERRALLQAGDVIRVVTDIIGRAEALKASSDEELLAIYTELERGLFADTLRGDLIFPLALRHFELMAPLEVGPDIVIEPMDDATQCARALSSLGGDGISPFLVSAATHAIVLKNREFSNSEGPLIRRIGAELTTRDTDEVEQVCQAIEVLSGLDVGYAQVCLRPQGWSDGWIADLPPVQKLKTVRRYPVALNNYAWNEQQPTITAELLVQLPRTYGALASTSKRAKLAARRLFQTSMREHRDDVVLDACIGIEALVGEEHDELVHRMGLRAAVALAGQGWKSTAVYELLKKVYGHRSKIVHGTEPKNATLSMAGSAHSFPVDSVAVYLLRELLKAHLTAEPPWSPQILDAQLFTAMDQSRQLSEPQNGG